MSDFGMKVSDEGVDALTAGPNQLLLNMEYPFAKIDRTNPTSYQTINLKIITEPPVVVDSTVSTLVYSFAHGYDYVPAMWALVENNYVGLATKGDDFVGDTTPDPRIASTGLFGYTSIYFNVDATNVYIYIYKSDGTFFGQAAPAIINSIFKIKIIVFVEDIGA